MCITLPYTTLIIAAVYLKQEIWTFDAKSTQIFMNFDPIQYRERLKVVVFCGNMPSLTFRELNKHNKVVIIGSIVEVALVRKYSMDICSLFKHESFLLILAAAGSRWRQHQQ